ncbi:hypothetical protein ES703_58509 [subsurface metagenome]
MTKTMPPPHTGPAIVQTLHQRDRTYEQRYVDCGKLACTRCGGAGARHPSHGPYWYLCVPRRKRWYRVYIGKVLDLGKYVTAAGETDWRQIMHRRLKRSDPVTRGDSSPPGEHSALDTVSDDPPDSLPQSHDRQPAAGDDPLIV